MGQGSFHNGRCFGTDRGSGGAGAGDAGAVRVRRPGCGAGPPGWRRAARGRRGVAPGASRSAGAAPAGSSAPGPSPPNGTGAAAGSVAPTAAASCGGASRASRAPRRGPGPVPPRWPARWASAASPAKPASRARCPLRRCTGPPSAVLLRCAGVSRLAGSRGPATGGRCAIPATPLGAGHAGVAGMLRACSVTRRTPARRNSTFVRPVTGVAW